MERELQVGKVDEEKAPRIVLASTKKQLKTRLHVAFDPKHYCTFFRIKFWASISPCESVLYTIGKHQRRPVGMSKYAILASIMGE
jgi:hypothetical protein